MSPKDVYFFNKACENKIERSSKIYQEFLETEVDLQGPEFVKSLLRNMGR